MMKQKHVFGYRFLVTNRNVFEGHEDTPQGGKGLKLVPCLIPQESHRLLPQIASAEVRSHSRVHPQYMFLFPSTKYSKDAVNGWYCIEEICKAALNVTEIRHCALTLFSTKEASEPERKAFFEHMGHSETVNKNIYQTPKAVQEVYQIESFFYSIDDKKSGNALSCLLNILTKW